MTPHFYPVLPSSLSPGALSMGIPESPAGKTSGQRHFTLCVKGKSMASFLAFLERGAKEPI